MWQEISTGQGHQKFLPVNDLVGLDLILLQGRLVGPGLTLVMSKDALGILGVDQEIIPDLQERRENLVVLVLEVTLEMEKVHVAVLGHVRDILEDPVQTVAKKLGIEEHTEGLIPGLGHALEIEGEDGHVLGSDTAEWCSREVKLELVTG